MTVTIITIIILKQFNFLGSKINMIIATIQYSWNVSIFTVTESSFWLSSSKIEPWVNWQIIMFIIYVV